MAKPVDYAEQIKGMNKLKELVYSNPNEQQATEALKDLIETSVESNNTANLDLLYKLSGTAAPTSMAAIDTNDLFEQLHEKYGSALDIQAAIFMQVLITSSFIKNATARFNFFKNLLDEEVQNTATDDNLLKLLISKYKSAADVKNTVITLLQELFDTDGFINQEVLDNFEHRNGLHFLAILGTLALSVEQNQFAAFCNSNSPHHDLGKLLSDEAKANYIHNQQQVVAFCKSTLKYTDETPIIKLFNLINDLKDLSDAQKSFILVEAMKANYLTEDNKNLINTQKEIQSNKNVIFSIVKHADSKRAITDVLYNTLGKDKTDIIASYNCCVGKSKEYSPTLEDLVNCPNMMGHTKQSIKALLWRDLQDKCPSLAKKVKSKNFIKKHIGCFFSATNKNQISSLKEIFNKDFFNYLDQTRTNSAAVVNQKSSRPR